VWEVEKGGREPKVRVEGRLVFNDTALVLHGGAGRFGPAYVLEGGVQEHLADGRLMRVLGSGSSRC
jgi:hypothetical protein